MTKVPELDWGKLRPQTPENKKHFKDDNDIYWRYKKKESPQSTSKRHGKVKLVDKRLFNDAHDQQEHLRSISKEEW